MRFDNWAIARETTEIMVSGDIVLTIAVSSSTPIMVYKLAGEDNPPEGQIILHPGNVTKRTLKLRGVESIVLKAENPKPEWCYAFKARPLQAGEPVDNIPPPDPAPASNLLKQMQDQFRRQMGVTREEFSDRPEHLPTYELDDNEPGLFEEEEQYIAAARDKLEKRQQRLEEKRNADAEREASEPPQSGDAATASQSPDNGSPSN